MNTKEYFLRNAHRVLKKPAGELKNPFLDPGSGYEGDLWDWDSYFTAKALCAAFSTCSDMEMKEAGCAREVVAAHIKGCVLNFLTAQENDGYIPIMLSGNGLFAGYFHGEHAKSIPLNQHKPFLCQAALQAGEFTGDYKWIDCDKLAAYLHYYEMRQFDVRSGLFIWQDDIMIGIDNNPTVYYRAPRSSADIYLNSFIVAEYDAMAEILRRNDKDATEYENKAATLRIAINGQMWDEHDGIYYSQDVGFVKTERSYNGFTFHEGFAPRWNTVPLKIRFWACFLPLYVGVCNEEQANRLCEHLHDPDVMATYGIRTLARNEKMYNLEKSNNPSNWLGPIWIVANYLTYKGLLRYKKTELAENLRAKTILLLQKNLEQYSEMFESYHPDTGAPNLFPGFLSWNLLAIELCEKNYIETKELPNEKR